MIVKGRIVKTNCTLKLRAPHKNCALTMKPLFTLIYLQCYLKVLFKKKILPMLDLQ